MWVVFYLDYNERVYYKERPSKINDNSYLVGVTDRSNAFQGKRFNKDTIEKEVNKMFELNPYSKIEYVGILDENGYVSEIIKFNRVNLLENEVLQKRDLNKIIT